MARRPGGPAVWTIRVDGHLDDHWSTWFSGLALTLENDGTTRLTGSVADQAAVHGLLAKIRDLGLTLVSAEAVLDQPGLGPTRAYPQRASRQPH